MFILENLKFNLLFLSSRTYRVTNFGFWTKKERKEGREKVSRRPKNRRKRMRTAASTKEGAPYAARFNVLVLNGRHPASPGGSRASAVETSCSLARSLLRVSRSLSPYEGRGRGRRETSNEWEYRANIPRYITKRNVWFSFLSRIATFFPSLISPLLFPRIFSGVFTRVLNTIFQESVLFNLDEGPKICWEIIQSLEKRIRSECISGRTRRREMLNINS